MKAMLQKLLTKKIKKYHSSHMMLLHGKAMGLCGSAQRLRAQTQNPPVAEKLQHLRGIVGQKEGTGAGG